MLEDLDINWILYEKGHCIIFFDYVILFDIIFIIELEFFKYKAHLGFSKTCTEAHAGMTGYFGLSFEVLLYLAITLLSTDYVKKKIYICPTRVYCRTSVLVIFEDNCYLLVL